MKDGSWLDNKISARLNQPIRKGLLSLDCFRANFKDGGHCRSLEESLSDLKNGFNEHNTGIHLAWVVDKLVEWSTNPKYGEVGYRGNEQTV